MDGTLARSLEPGRGPTTITTTTTTTTNTTATTATTATTITGATTATTITATTTATTLSLLFSCQSIISSFLAVGGAENEELTWTPPKHDLIPCTTGGEMFVLWEVFSA